MSLLPNTRQALQLLKEGHTCVIVRDGLTLISDKTGISPMLDWLQQGISLEGACAADKIVGKAAALLFAKAGIREVYAEVLSEAGKSILDREGISADRELLVPMIINRTGTGMCPMEQTVLAIEDPEEAYAALLETRRRLRGF